MTRIMLTDLAISLYCFFHLIQVVFSRGISGGISIDRHMQLGAIWAIPALEIFGPSGGKKGPKVS